MAQSVTNEALWVKLSEVEQRLDKLLIGQKSLVPTQEPAENKPDLTKVKEDITTKIKDEISILGLSSDLHFEANRKNIEAITEIIQKVWNIVSRIRKQQREAVESPENDKKSYLDFKFFKVRKTAVMIAILGTLVFILTLLCMKQQNDYALLMEEYYRQSVVLKGFEVEIDSLRLH
ncbi:hypothetical protein [Dysgonomonas sp.]